jgi:hypothetical protein
MSKFQRYLLGMFFVILGMNILGLWAVQFLSYRRLSKLENVSTNLESDVAIAIRLSSESKEKEEINIDDVVEANVLTRKAEEEVKETSEVAVADSKENQDFQELKTEQGVLSSLMDQLQDKLTSLSSRLKLVENYQATSTNAPASTVAPVITQPVTVVAPTIKEQTVYIGSGSSSSTNWTDIDSAVIELNSANYSNLNRVIFEANLSIIGGEAYARLKNKTTGQVIEISTVSHNNSTSTQKLSGSFGLTSGSNEYVVQLRSSSNEKVILDGARLRLFY